MHRDNVHVAVQVLNRLYRDLSMSKTVGGIAIGLNKTNVSNVRVYGTELATRDEVVIMSGANEWRGPIRSVNRAGTVGRATVRYAGIAKVQSEVDDEDVTFDDDLVAITITITGTPGSASGMAVING